MSLAVILPPTHVRRFSSDVVLSKPGRYERSGRDDLSRFNQLVQLWRDETALVSSTDELFEHPAFREIVAMGARAVPLVVRELSRGPDLLVGALAEITGEDPVAEADRGDVYAMAVAWIEWYRRRS